MPNKNIRIDGKPVFYKTFFDTKISDSIRQLGLSKSKLESMDILKNEIKRM